MNDMEGDRYNKQLRNTSKNGVYRYKRGERTENSSQQDFTFSYRKNIMVEIDISFTEVQIVPEIC